MKKDKSYRQLNKELERIIALLDQELDDIDKAIDLYDQGEDILKQIDKYLSDAKTKVDKAKNRSRK